MPVHALLAYTVSGREGASLFSSEGLLRPRSDSECGMKSREHPIDRDGLWPVAYGLGMIRGPTDYTTTFKPHDFSLSPTSPHSYSIHYCHVDRLDFIPRNMTYFKRDKKEKMPCDN